MKKPDCSYVRGIVEAIVSDYKENESDKGIEVEVEALGQLDFKVLLWFPVDAENRDFDIDVIRPDHSIKQIRTMIYQSLDLIVPFKESVSNI